MAIHAVTGATGMLGSHVVEALRKRGEAVRALVRPSADTAWLASQGVEIVHADLDEPASLVPAVEGASTVFHCAAKVGDWGPWRLFQRAIVEATGNLLVACQAAGVGRFLHVSSINVYGRVPLKPGQRLSEDDPLGQQLWWWDHYCRAKIEAEGLVRAYPLPWTIVRPSWIYGPRDRNSVPRAIRAIESGAARVIGDGTNRLNIVHAADVAEGVVRAALSPVGERRAYNLSSEGVVTQREFMDAITSALKLPPITRTVPYGLAITGGFLMEAMGRMLGWREPPFLTRYAVALIGRPTSYSIDRARTELGWSPRIHPFDGLRQVLAAMGRLQEAA
ncbi:MAG: NAD-dependent epimerase/dehydratase family protein [Gemmataceae bacterium]|nr:NAD-dependent epimerase/dehydratase family protein [Gemmataceae bacterium]